jgi:hypothetical protein
VVTQRFATKEEIQGSTSRRKSCFCLLDTKGLYLWISLNRERLSILLYCSLYRETTEAEDPYCYSEAIEERKSSPSTWQFQSLYSSMTREATAKFEWTVISHMPYIHGPFTIRISSVQTNEIGLHKKHFWDDDAVTVTIKKLQQAGSSYTMGGYSPWYSSGENAYKYVVITRNNNSN